MSSNMSLPALSTMSLLPPETIRTATWIKSEQSRILEAYPPHDSLPNGISHWSRYIKLRLTSMIEAHLRIKLLGWRGRESSSSSVTTHGLRASLNVDPADVFTDLERALLEATRGTWSIEATNAANALVKARRFQDWVGKIEANSILFVDSFATQHPEVISPMSVLVSRMVLTIWGLPEMRACTIYFFCGAHSDAKAADRYYGPIGMMRSLNAQLLRLYQSSEQREPGLDEIRRYNPDTIGDDPKDLESLCNIFYWLATHLARIPTVFCLIDGIDSFEEEIKPYYGRPSTRIVGLEQILDNLRFLVGRLAITEKDSIVKILITSSSNSKYAKQHEVLDIYRQRLDLTEVMSNNS